MVRQEVVTPPHPLTGSAAESLLRLVDFVLKKIHKGEKIATKKINNVRAVCCRLLSLIVTKV